MGGYHPEKSRPKGPKRPKRPKGPKKADIIQKLPSRHDARIRRWGFHPRSTFGLRQKSGGILGRVSPGKIKANGTEKGQKGQKLFKNYLVGMMHG